jgi:type I restriction enzyme S subunit
MDWPLHKLEDLTERDRPITYGVVKPGPEDPENGVKFIRGGDIFEGKLAIESLRTITSDVSKSYRRTLLSGGELVVSLVGNPGHVAIVPKSLAGANLARQAGLVALRPNIDADFVKYFLMSPGGRAELFSQMTGSVQIVINLANLRTVRVPLPPLPIQRRIAGILSAYDELIENSQRRIQILEEMARSLYREWFVNFRYPGYESVPLVPSPLGEIPQGWEVRKLGDISSYISRGISPRYDDEGTSLVLNQKCVREQRLSLEPARRQSKPIQKDKLIQFGDVVINSTGVGTLGRVAQIYEILDNCTVDSHVTIARASKNTDLDFYGACLLRLESTFERLGVGATGQTELGRSAIYEAEVVVPTEELQRQFGKVSRGMRSAANVLGSQIQNLRQTRDLLLPRLMSGQLEVTVD